MLFEQLGLSTDLLRAVAEQGYEKPTPIQEKAIPAILEGKDVMGGAQTGTGKTAGFTLPMLRRLELYANNSMSPARHPIRGLVLVPTRELAIQVYESVKNYSKYTALKSTLVYGGVNLDSQVEAIRNGVEILVATPGRLLDHIQQKNIVLSKTEILVLDEADRMLDMGFLPDIMRILNLLPEKRQNLMFSATFSDDIKKLANQLLQNPVLIEATKRNSVSDLISHVVYTVETERKPELLVHLIKQQKLKQALVFHRTKSGSDQLAKQLIKHGISTATIHGDKNQQQRCQALEDFKQGDIQVLVATDVAARGLDIDELFCVINYELPSNPEDYVHRIGRTGRAGAKGYAISLVCQAEKKLLSGIEKLIQKKIIIKKASGFDHVQAKKKSVQTKKIQDSPTSKRSISDEKTKNTGTNAEVIYFNGERVRREVRKLDRSQDPLFTQPYIPRESKNGKAGKCGLNQKETSQSKSRRVTKMVPALFIPPVSK